MGTIPARGGGVGARGSSTTIDGGRGVRCASRRYVAAMGFPPPAGRFVHSFLAAGLAAGLAAQGETATVHGRAVDANGKPMAGCAVGLFELGARFDTKALLARPLATTDAQGSYQLTAQRDRYHVVVVAAKGCQVCVQRLPNDTSPVRHVTDALMLPGTTLRGRVRDAAGAPIAGARVRVEDPLTAGTFTTAWFESSTTSDAKGIFDVPGVPRTGLRVTVSAPGFPAVSRFAAHDSPLDFTLAATGLLRGRVVDRDGKPVAGAGVSVATVARQYDVERVVSDDDGRFTVTAPHAARFRIAAYEGKVPYRQFSSALLRGPAQDVVVTTRDGAGSRRVVLRCVDAATKAPITEFRASWSSIDSKTAVVAVMRHADNRVAHRDEARIDVCADRGDTSLGTIVVDAPGHGLAIVPVPDDPTEPLLAELPAERFLTGRVLDAETGQPAVGAAVHALWNTKGSSTFGCCPDPWRDGAVTDAEGRYRLGGLADGSYDVQVYGRGRQASRSKRVTLDGAETTLDLEVPKARFLAFELVGDVPEGCLGTIEWSGGFSSSLDGGSMLEAVLPPPPILSLQGPRTHRIGPVGNAHYRATLRLPTRDRLGSGTAIDLGEIDGDGQRIELPDLRQFVHRGRVQLPSDVPPERIALVANRVAPGGRNDPFADIHRQPSAVALGSEGSFVIDLPPGRYALQLVDLETKLVFHTEDDDRELGAATAATPLDIRPTVRWLELRFAPATPGTDVELSSVAIDVERPRGGALPAVFGSGSGSNTRQQSHWAPVAGATQTRWLVGPGNLKLGARQSFQSLSPEVRGRQEQPVDSAEVDVTEAKHVVTLRLPPPPSDAEIVGAAK